MTQARIRQITIAAALLAVLALIAGMNAPPFSSLAQGHTSMLSVHLLLELFAVIIAMLVVVVSWHTFDAQDARSANVLIAGFLIVAVCDVVHALTYDGMPDLLAPSSTPRAIFFWLMGRTFEVITLGLVAVQWVPRWSRGFGLAVGLLTSSALVWIGSYEMALFPVTFVKGQGVTAFKADYEYVLCLANMVVALVFWRRAQHSAQHSAQPRDYVLALSSFVMGVGEIMFTAYVAPSDFQNVFGHTYKVAAYALLYWATFVTSVRAPFEDVVRSEGRLRESEERIRSLSNNIPKSMVFQMALEPDGTLHYLHVSESAQQLYGLAAQDLVQDRTLLDRLMDPQDVARLAEVTRHSAELLEPLDMSFAVRPDRAALRWIHISSAPRRATGGRIIWDGVHTDITERKRAEDEIARLGFYDSLTGLPNRRLLMDRLGQVLQASQRSGHCGALLFLDLDNFKDFNDTLGHDMGDELLKQVASRLVGCIRGRDTVSRFGGDEFVVILDDLSTDMGEAATEARSVAEKFLNRLREPFKLGKEHRFITLSIGISLFGDRPTSIDEMMKSADLAMYRAKAAGRNALRFFDPEMQTAVTERAALESDLRLALQDGQFVLHYQPLVEGEHTICVEALVRWQHPQRGLIPPTKFIPLAEETGLIVPLGQWILEAASQQLVQWAGNAATDHLKIAVNVSARQFRQPDFAEQTLATLERTGARPSRLKIELTESLLVDDMDAVVEKMVALQVRGVTFALDDFGTGYSSLSYLKRLPLSALKIDQSFVRDILIDTNDAAIARTIIALGQSLGLDVIAEGVETEGQHDFLLRHGCHIFQGYLFCKPLPVAELEQFLAQ